VAAALRIQSDVDQILAEPRPEIHPETATETRPPDPTITNVILTPDPPDDTQATAEVARARAAQQIDMPAGPLDLDEMRAHIRYRLETAIGRVPSDPEASAGPITLGPAVNQAPGIDPTADVYLITHANLLGLFQAYESAFYSRPLTPDGFRAVTWAAKTLGLPPPCFDVRKEPSFGAERGGR
jgi:hypothetical protein